MGQFDAFKRLIAKIYDGEVVFFVGAGFSVDSEGNTSVRLMRRLLVRFDAMQSILNKHPSSSSELSELPANLRRTFDFKQNLKWDFNDDVKILANKYYEANDWFCGTFHRLLQEGAKQCGLDSLTSDPPQHEAAFSESQSLLCDLINAIWQAENSTLKTASDHIQIDPIDPRLFFWASDAEQRSDYEHSQHAGKSLFLDTMGFANEQIMVGGWAKHRDATTASFQNKLFPRHHVLARLAREGFCPMAMTTNYDLLLEGAWRLSGFDAENIAKDPLLDATKMPSLPLEQMARVGKATEFFRFERGNRTANVVKVHGCVELYRQARNTTCKPFDTMAWLQRDMDLESEHVTRERWQAWQNYLPSMVFTYREIQHWRGDSWARDYLATTQRTRNVVFMGYSLQDPVIHDAFRGVYEDMRRMRIRVDGLRDDEQTVPAEHAPAWFWSSYSKDSFHANEVLDAASAATGRMRSERKTHPNTLKFARRNDGFPDYDDAMLWIFHRTFRKVQLECLKSNLVSLSNGLLPLPLARSEHRTIVDRFEQLIADEDQAARKLLEHNNPNGDNLPNERRREWLDMVHWTYSFGSNLIKELVAVDMLQRNGGPSMELTRLRCEHWYHPARANRNATAWGAVVEIAIRTLFELRYDAKKDSRLPVQKARCSPGVSPLPIVFGSLQKSTDLIGSNENILLQILAGAPNRVGAAKNAYGVHKELHWILSVDRFPWPTKSIKNKQPPDAAEMLQLAQGIALHHETLPSDSLTQVLKTSRNKKPSRARIQP